MTNEEKIAELINIRDNYNYTLAPREVFDDAIKALEQEPCDFAKWVATEIFDDNWEYNKGAFEELACRKLAKMGIVKANGDKWELVEPQESEVQDADSN